MKHFLGTLLCLAFLIGPHSLALADTPAILGQWQYSGSNNGFTADIVFDFEPDVLNVTATCRLTGDMGLGPTAVTKLTVPIQITDTQVTILQSGYATNSQNGINCPISASATTSNYQVQGNLLTISGNGQSVTFTRAK